MRDWAYLEILREASSREEVADEEWTDKLNEIDSWRRNELRKLHEQCRKYDQHEGVEDRRSMCGNLVCKRCGMIFRYDSESKQVELSYQGRM